MNKQLVLGCLECSRFALLVLLSALHSPDLDQVLLILLLQSLELGLFVKELQLVLVSLLSDLSLGGFSLSEELSLGGEFLLKLLLLIDHFLDVIVSANRQRRAALNNLGEVSDLGAQVLDDAASAFLLLLGGLDELPGAVDFLLEERDGGRIFLGQAQGSLHPCGVTHNRVIELLAAFNEAFLRLVGGLEGAVQFLVLILEARHGFFTDHAIKHGLEVLLQLFILLLVQAHRNEGVLVCASSCGVSHQLF